MFEAVFLNFKDKYKLCVNIFFRLKNLRNNRVGTLKYILGRFLIVRKLRFFYLTYFDNGKKIMGNKKIYIEDINQKKALGEICEKGVSVGLKLKDETINKFSNFIKESNTKEHEGFGRNFDIESAKEFNSFNPPNPVLIIDHLSKDLNLFAEEVARSYPLLNIAEDYLGKVKKITTKVQTSLIADASRKYRDDNGQTVTFHYDVEGYSFLYVFFYLTKCDSLSGAHEFIFNSHKKKKLEFLFSGARKSDNLIYNSYHKDACVISGEPGFGFIEDTSCYHRALAPKKSSRTCFQIRYIG